MPEKILILSVIRGIAFLLVIIIFTTTFSAAGHSHFSEFLKNTSAKSSKIIFQSSFIPINGEACPLCFLISQFSGVYLSANADLLINESAPEKLFIYFLLNPSFIVLSEHPARGPPSLS
ncbi:MAG: hypothetical protein HYU63_03865 [Armatimonadetes bacterium]|nr:hypothetical protein [Armatimonadota bacterium]